MITYGKTNAHKKNYGLLAPVIPKPILLMSRVREPHGVGIRLNPC